MTQWPLSQSVQRFAHVEPSAGVEAIMKILEDTETTCLNEVQCLAYLRLPMSSWLEQEAGHLMEE